MATPLNALFRQARPRPLYVPLRATLLITWIHPPPPRCHLILSGEASNDLISQADRVNGEFDPSLDLSHQANKIKPPRMKKLLFKFHLNIYCLNCEGGQTNTQNIDIKPHNNQPLQFTRLICTQPPRLDMNCSGKNCTRPPRTRSNCTKPPGRHKNQPLQCTKPNVRSQMYEAARNGDKQYGRENCWRKNGTRSPKETKIVQGWRGPHDNPPPQSARLNCTTQPGTNEDEWHEHDSYEATRNKAKL